MTECDILFANKEQRLKDALEKFEKSFQDLEQDINIIKEWFKTQPHLPELPVDNILTNFLILNKFSIEKCKENLDMYYTLRPLIPEVFHNKNPKLPHMKLTAKTMSYVTMPKLTEEGYRVTFIRLMNDNANDFSPYDVTAHFLNLFEIRLLNDVMIGEIYIIDMKNFTFAHISKITPMVLKKIFAPQEKVFKNLLKQMHYVNVAPIVENLINLIKQVVKLKLASRMFAHKNCDVLKDYLSIDLLPKEYGGKEYSWDELNDLWMQQLDKHQYRFHEIEKFKIDESKRPAPLINDDLLGFHGNFKKLNVD